MLRVFYLTTIAVVVFRPALLAAPHGGSVRWGDRPLPGATVTARLGEKKLVTSTGEDGNYSFKDLEPGEWRIEVEMFGFAPVSQPLQAGGEPSSLEFSLDLKPRTPAGQLSPAVSGSAGPAERATAAQPVRKTDSRKPSSASRRKPGEGQFVELTSNPKTADPEDGLAEFGPAEIEDAGASDSFLVTGSVTRGLEDARKEESRSGRSHSAEDGFPEFGANPPMPDGPSDPGFGSRPSSSGSSKRGFDSSGSSRGEFGKGSKGYSGGKKRGSSSRSRTSIGNRRQKNDIRGSLSYSLRNSALDARPFSLSGEMRPKPSYAQSRYSFSAGGPLKIPGLLESEGTFFYFSYSGHRSRNPYDTVNTLPSLRERSGDFSQSVARGPVTIYDPLSNEPFAGNLIPKNRINPAAAGLLAFVPLPTFTGTVQNYQFLTSVPSNSDNYSVRLNQTISRRDRLAFNVNIRGSDTQTAQAFGFRDAGQASGISSTASYTRNFSPRITSNLTWSFTRSRNDLTPYFAGVFDVARELGISGVSADPRNWGPPNLSFTNFGSLTDGAPSVRRNQTSSVGEGLTISRKGHTITLGGSLRRMQINSFAENGRGSFSFSGLKTSGLDADHQPLPGSGFDFADFLLGFPQSSSIRFGSANTYFRAQAYSAYANDDWRVNRSLSFNLGLRYEYFTPFAEKFGKIANLDVAPGFTGVAVVTPGKTGPYSGRFPDALVNPDKKLFSPRLGMALRPRKLKNTTLRAGYSLFFNGSIYNQFPSRLASQPPFATTGSATTSTAHVLTLQNGFADAPNQKITNTFAVDKDYLVPYVQTWNFTLQRSFRHGLFASLGYMGNKGTRLDIQRQPNRSAPGGSPLTSEQRRQIGNATGFTYDTSIGNSIYHGFDAQIARRFQRGVSASLNYIYAKAIDNSASFGGGVAQDDYNLRAERGLSSFDQRHNLTANYYLTSPMGERGLLRTSRWGGRFLADWSLSGRFTLLSGSPLTARVLGNRANSGGAIGSGRADATGLDVREGPGFFNLLAFAIPAPGRFGGAGRNTIPGPSRFTSSIGLGRSFRLGPDSKRRIEFRFESTNFLNHVSYGSLGTVVNASNYGLALSAAAMRSNNATLRLRF